MTTNTLAKPERATEKVGPLSLKLAPASRQRLRTLAEIQRRPAHALAREAVEAYICLLYTSPSPRDRTRSRMPSSA